MPNDAKIRLLVGHAPHRPYPATAIPGIAPACAFRINPHEFLHRSALEGNQCYERAYLKYGLVARPLIIEESTSLKLSGDGNDKTGRTARRQ